MTSSTHHSKNNDKKHVMSPERRAKARRLIGVIGSAYFFCFWVLSITIDLMEGISLQDAITTAGVFFAMALLGLAMIETARMERKNLELTRENETLKAELEKNRA